ncbi:tRNA (guanine-N(7)-)-methyltransferase [Rhizoctonia solani]|uniref:tRNA (guanine-N(7)-)-methyltransferase n=1 Tax=Rhizoctonia solani TaxID=456999 RepID=A0A8H7I8B5_9AGAM|nr:tRNA (guanine-N(7)-)-methyltransferase [Rhizoctonia solani]
MAGLVVGVVYVTIPTVSLFPACLSWSLNTIGWMTCIASMAKIFALIAESQTIHNFTSPEVIVVARLSAPTKRKAGEIEASQAPVASTSLLPQKRHYRQRAHANPFSDHYLSCVPGEMDWSPHYPNRLNHRVEFADIGCGFGGLLIALAPMYPETLMLGMEIRVQVTQYVTDRIAALRQQSIEAQVRFDAQENKSEANKPAELADGGIRTPTLLAEYAYVLRPGGIVYTVTDVEELHLWMVAHLETFPAFERIPDEEATKDPVTPHILNATEEGKKVQRNNGRKWIALFRRKNRPMREDS